MNAKIVFALALLLLTSLSTAGTLLPTGTLDLTPGSIDIGLTKLVSSVDLPNNTILVKQDGVSVGQVQLLNPVVSQTLTDCDLTVCKVKLLITPSVDTTLANLKGTVIKNVLNGVSTTASVTFDSVEIQKGFTEPVIERVNHPYFETSVNKTTGKTDTVFFDNYTLEQTSTKTVSRFVPLDPKEILTAGSKNYINLAFKRKYQFGLNTDLSLSVFGLDVTTGPLDPWWNATFKEYINFTANTTVSSNLTNFPVFVSFNSASLISGGTMDSQCSGIRAIDKTDTIQYSMELESGSCNTVNTTVWVLLPTASSVPFDNEIHLYYDNQSAVSSVSNGPATFSNNFTHVWHLGETSGNFTDSSPSGWHSQSITNVTRLAAGNNGCRRGGCAWIGANNGNIDFGNVGNVTAGDKLSLSMWVNMSPITQTFIEVYGKKGNVDFGQWTRLAYAYLSGGDQIYRVTTGVYGVNSWTHHAFTWTAATGSSAVMYVNGSSAAAAWDLGTGNTGPTSVADHLQLSPTSGYIGIPGWTGVLDEVRRANVTRSADWVKAEYGQTFTNQGTSSLTPIPTYTSLSTTPANQSIWSSGLYVSFNASWNNTPTTEVFNLDGTNYSVSVNANLSSTKLSAGYHSWYSLASNAGGANQTPTFSFYLQPANASFTFLLNSSTSSLTLLVGSASNASVTNTNLSYAVSVSLLRNGTVIQTSTVPPQLDNYTLENTLGTFNLTAKFAGDVNYTQFQISRMVNVVSSFPVSNATNSLPVPAIYITLDDSDEPTLPVDNSVYFLIIIAFGLILYIIKD